MHLKKMKKPNGKEPDKANNDTNLYPPPSTEIAEPFHRHVPPGNVGAGARTSAPDLLS